MLFLVGILPRISAFLPLSSVSTSCFSLHVVLVALTPPLLQGQAQGLGWPINQDASLFGTTVTGSTIGP